jgi:hypothetical protein
MSPDPSPSSVGRTFGRTAGQAARAAFLLALLGWGAVWYLDRLLTRKGTPVGEVLLRFGFPPGVTSVVGGVCVAAIAAYGFWKSVRSTDRFRIAEDGLHVTGSLGQYVLEWPNLKELGVTAGGSLGVRVRDRGALLATHKGSAEQRHWLETMPPFGEWDLVFPRADLGVSPETVLGWLAPYLRPDAAEDPPTDC